MTQPIPEGHEGLIPHLICDPCAEAIEFYKQAFGAEETTRMPGPDGKRIMHAAILIDRRPLFLNDDFPEMSPEGKECSPKALGGSPVTVHRYVENVDAAAQRAIDAGATVVMPVEDCFWGDRYGILKDPFGHNWSLATHISDPTPEEMAAAMQEMGEPGG
ncbi:MAG: VOC family protein [Thermoanaerobaculia bacterium]